MDFEARRALTLPAYLVLAPGWKLYALADASQSSRRPASIARSLLAPPLVAARSIDRVLRRGIRIDARSLGSFLLPSGAGGARVGDARAAIEVVRLLASGQVLTSGMTGDRLWDAARLLAKPASADQKKRERARGIHESLHRTRLRVLGARPLRWGPRALRLRDGSYRVHAHVYRVRPRVELCAIVALVRASGGV